MSQSKAPVSGSRRTLLIATGAVGAVGAAAVAVPFVLSMTPSARARAAGAPVEVDISKVEPGMMITVEWRGRPVWIIHRTKEMLEALPKLDALVADPKSDQPLQPEYAKNESRALKPAPTAVWATTGSAASCALATVRSSTSPAASSRACRRRSTSPFRPTST
jgi:ubiquinol-cytochrome c reductase iron-sulfur subunit